MNHFQQNKPKPEGLVVKNVRLIRKLGVGSFGETYLGTSIHKESEVYAVKLEDKNTKHPQLYFEAKLYLHIGADCEKGFPKMHAVTTEGPYNIMIMDLLGKNLEDLFTQNSKKLSLKTVLMLTDQMLQRIEYLHSMHFIHRDIKPDNFLMGIGINQHKVFMIDLGLAKKYIKEGVHCAYKDGLELAGTARYASVNTHKGIEQSRRDDLESLGYVMLYFLRGSLPWQNLVTKDLKHKYQLIKEKKISVSLESLCKGYPTCFLQYMQYVRGLKFDEQPDYKYLRDLFQKEFVDQNFLLDYQYDWTADKHDISSSSTRNTKNSTQKEDIAAQTKRTNYYKMGNKQESPNNQNGGVNKRNTSEYRPTRMSIEEEHPYHMRELSKKKLNGVLSSNPPKNQACQNGAANRWMEAEGGSNDKN